MHQLRTLSATWLSILLLVVASFAPPAAAQARALTKAEKVAAILDARAAGERRLIQRLAQAIADAQDVCVDAQFFPFSDLISAQFGRDS